MGVFSQSDPPIALFAAGGRRHGRWIRGCAAARVQRLIGGVSASFGHPKLTPRHLSFHRRRSATAWDTVEELNAAASHAKATKTSDPLEEYCEGNPDADECRVYGENFCMHHSLADPLPIKRAS